MADREVTGDADLYEGGVGRDAEGAGSETRASKDIEFGPSI